MPNISSNAASRIPEKNDKFPSDFAFIKKVVVEIEDDRPSNSDSERVGRDSERVGRDSKRVGRDSKRVGRDSERAGRDSERVGRDSERAGRDSERVGRDSERVGRVSNPIKGLMGRLKKHEELNLRQRDILQARDRLGEFGLSVNDLNRKIERLEKITAKWKGAAPTRPGK